MSSGPVPDTAVDTGLPAAPSVRCGARHITARGPSEGPDGQLTAVLHGLTSAGDSTGVGRWRAKSAKRGWQAVEAAQRQRRAVDELVQRTSRLDKLEPLLR